MRARRPPHRHAPRAVLAMATSALMTVSCASGEAPPATSARTCAPAEDVPSLGNEAHLIAARHYLKNKQWKEGTRELLSIVQGRTKTTPETVEEAQYLLGLSLSHAEEPSNGTPSSSHKVMALIASSSTHRYRGSASRWLCLHPTKSRVEVTEQWGRLLGFEAPRVASDPVPSASALPTPPKAEGETAELDCSSACSYGPSAVCWNMKTKKRACTCDALECETGGGLVLCESDDECLPAGKGMYVLCEQELEPADAVGKLTRWCSYRFVHSPGRDVEEEPAQPKPSLECSTIAECTKTCRKFGKDACRPLFEFAENQFKSTSTGAIAAATREFSLGCDKGFAPACNALAFAHGTGRGVARSLKRMAKLYRRACKLSGDDADCGQAESAECVASTWSPSRRAPELDGYCNPRNGKPGRGPVKAYNPQTRTKPIWDDPCFSDMDSMGCSGINTEKHGRSAYCCK